MQGVPHSVSAIKAIHSADSLHVQAVTQNEDEEETLGDSPTKHSHDWPSVCTT